MNLGRLYKRAKKLRRKIFRAGLKREMQLRISIHPGSLQITVSRPMGNYRHTSELSECDMDISASGFSAITGRRPFDLDYTSTETLLESFFTQADQLLNSFIARQRERRAA